MAGFWPLSPRHRARQALFGTADQAWIDSVFPEDPRDTDPGFYNMAPADQQRFAIACATCLRQSSPAAWP